MPALRELLSGAGYGDVATYVQSGNIVLSSDHPPDRLERELHKLIDQEMGVDTEVVVRTEDELADVVARNPIHDATEKPKLFQVTFLSEELDAGVAEKLEARDFAPERLVVSGRELYAWHPDGMQRSKLARTLSDKTLGVTATARNWNTVTKLLELAKVRA